jgi:hypothetical protein
VTLRPTHLTLAQRKAVATKLAIIEALEALGPQAAVCGCHDHVQSIEQRLRAQANAALREDALTAGPLDGFLQSLLDEVKSIFPRNLNGDSQRIFAELETRLSATLGGIVCTVCSNRVCNGSDDDHQTVAQGGLCMARILEMQKLVEKETDRLYLEGIEPNLKPSIVFSTLNDCDTDSLFEEQVTPLTRYHDGDSTRLSEVILGMGLEKFELSGLEALPYALFHEYVAHAYQGILARHPREHAAAHDMFIEGWMDFVAYQLMLRVVARNDQLWPRNCEERAARMRARRKDYRDSRLTFEQKGRAAHLVIGDEAASRVFALFGRLYQSPEDAWNGFMEFSAALDMAWSRADAIRFENALTTLGELIASDRPSSFDAIGAICDFLKERDADRFVTRVLALGTNH